MTVDRRMTDRNGNAPVRRQEFTRRGVLAGTGIALAAVGVTVLPARVAAADVTVEEFLALSERLTQTGDLDSTVASGMLDGFLATGRGAGLRRLIDADGTGQDEDLANAIVAAWYSGLYATPQGPAVATYNGALVWTALPFTKPPTECGGETGYWADPPET